MKGYGSKVPPPVQPQGYNFICSIFWVSNWISLEEKVSLLKRKSGGERPHLVSCPLLCKWICHCFLMSHKRLVAELEMFWFLFCYREFWVNFKTNRLQVQCSFSKAHRVYFIKNRVFSLSSFKIIWLHYLACTIRNLRVDRFILNLRINQCKWNHGCKLYTMNK